MVTRIEFGSRDAANNIRNDSQFRGFLADSDDARTATVVLKDATPQPAVDEIVGAAADSKSHEANKAGQVDLTRRERNQIDFSRSGMNVPKARSIKAIAQQEGVSDWIHRADFTLSVDENRRILKRGKREGGGQRGGRDRESDTEVDRRLADAYQEQQQNELGRAKDFALLETDTEAQGFLSEQGSVGDVFDVGFNRTDDDRLEGYGEDYDRLEERHENRPERAQTLDEKQTAPVTRDPVQWTNNPGAWDFPGIDTVQPQELHEQRSDHAQAVDERDLAPIADTREQWAMHPDEYDWLGVDTPNEPVRDEPRESASSGGEFFREIDGQRMPASVALEDDPVSGGGQRVDAPGLAPGDLEGEFDESIGMSSTNEPFGLAGGEEADMAFVQAEEERAQGGGLGGFTDDRAREGQLTDFGMETDATQHRESRQAEEQASMFGVDDRESVSRGTGNDSDSGEQQGFEVFGGGVRENETLF